MSIATLVTTVLKPPVNPWLAMLSGLVVGQFFGSSIWGGILGLASWGLGQIQ